MKREGANPKEAERWLAQAETDLRAARDSAATGHHDWACFQAQQCGELAMKAALFYFGYRRIGSHTLHELVDVLTKHTEEIETVRSHAIELDKFYLPTRYPNGLPSAQIPATRYTAKESTACISFAESILNASTSIVRGSRP